MRRMVRLPTRPECNGSHRMAVLCRDEEVPMPARKRSKLLWSVPAICMAAMLTSLSGWATWTPP
jgi:hypothetical protein